MESHLLLLPVVLLRCILLFFISIRRLWLLSFSCVRFVSSESRSESKWICLTLRLRCWDSVCCRTVIFLSVYGNCLCILSDRYFGLDACHGGTFLVAGLCYIVLCFTVTLYSCLSSFASCHLKSVEHYFWSFGDVADAYSMCVFGWVSCVCSSQKEAEHEQLEAGKAVHYTWTEPTGSRELCWKCGSYSGKLKSEEVPYPTWDTPEFTKQTSWLLTISRVKRPLTLYF